MVFYSLEKLSLVDFDGYISATIFTGGCNFKCGYCHNSLLVLSHTTLSTLSEESVLDYLKKRFGILEGLCITGGEPTLHATLPQFIAKVKNIGYKVKLDTNGTNPNMLKSLFNDNLIDYVAMDIKNCKEDYASVIGLNSFDTKNVEKSVEFLLSNQYDYEFRTTLIKEFHTEHNIDLIGQWIKGAKRYFLQKFKNSESCIESHFSTLDENIAKKYVEILKPYIPNTQLRGY